jgi:DNA-binding beta-propeller fold protein YncE
MPHKLAVCLLTAIGAFAQTTSAQLPDPYRAPIENWGRMPEGRMWGSTSGIAIDPKGNIWVAERCGGNTCAGSNLDPVFEFDPAGKYLRSFGAGMFVFPHQIYVDKDGFVWVSDADGKDGKGHTVVKFSPDGKVVMALGKQGVAGSGPDTFNRPSGVAVAANGDIFVSDGHGGDSNARIVKFSKDGKFIKSWGKKGSAPGELDGLHGLAIDKRGRVLVADRDNNRIQIFDQDGKFLDRWTQFGRPSGIFIDKNDVIYVPDNTSNGKNHAGWPRGIYIGNAKDGKVTGFIPDPDQDDKHEGFGPENAVADGNGTIYAAEVSRKMIKVFVKK